MQIHIRIVKLILALALAVFVNAQVAADQPGLKSDVAVEVHLKAVKLIEISGGRDRLVAGLPEMIELAKTAMQKQCTDCNPAYIAEWGKRMTARLKVDDIVSVAVQAYEKRFTDDELTEILAAVSSQKTAKFVPVSPTLQKKMSDLLPAIMGEVTGATTEIGARLGGEIGAEIEKEHPEYFPAKPRPDKP